MNFATDSVGFSTGFRIELSLVASPCGQSIIHLNETSANTVSIRPPMNGDKYMPNMNCLWEIKSDGDKLIDIKFTQFDLEGDDSNKCLNDYLEIGDEEVNFKFLFFIFLLIDHFSVYVLDKTIYKPRTW